MKPDRIRGYYFITDKALSRRGNISDIKSAIKSSVSIIQYRTKNDSTVNMIKEASIIKKLCRKSLFIINDRIDVAFSIDADGIHIGQGDMPYALVKKILGMDKIIGVSVNSIEEAVLAEKNGASYLGVGPIFKTSTKSDAGMPSGIKLIKDIKRHSSLPIVAIGGITLENGKSVINAGASSICAISAVVTKPDVKKEIKKFQSLFI